MFKKKPAPPPSSPTVQSGDGKKKMSRKTMAIISVPFVLYGAYIALAPVTNTTPTPLPDGGTKKPLDLTATGPAEAGLPPTPGSGAIIELAPSTLGPPLSAEDTKMRGQALLVRLKADEGCESIPAMVNDLDFSAAGDLTATNKRLDQLESIADQADCLNT